MASTGGSLVRLTAVNSGTGPTRPASTSCMLTIKSVSWLLS